MKKSMKKILSAAVAAAAAITMTGVPSFAAGETYIRNINLNHLTTGAVGNVGSGNITFSDRNSGKTTVMEESGELAGDKYVQIDINSNVTGSTNIMWSNLQNEYQNPMYIEFDYKTANGNRKIFLQSCFEKSRYQHNFLTIEPDGKMTLGDSSKTASSPQKKVATAYAPLKLNNWYHIGVAFGTDTAALYVDGEKLTELEWSIGGLTATNSTGTPAAAYFNIFTAPVKTGVDSLCFDNFKIYQSANGFDDASPRNAAYISSVTDAVTLDKTALKLSLNGDMTAEEITNAVTLAPGATSVCDIESGTFTVTSANRKISRVYTISVPEITSRVYKIDEDNAKISPVYKYTSVPDFIASFTGHGVNLGVVNADGEAVTEGYVSEDMKLRATAADDNTFYTDYALVFDNGIIDVNFDRLTLGTYWRDGFKTNLGAASPGTNANFSVVSDDEKGSDVLQFSGKGKTSFAFDSQCSGHIPNYKEYAYTGYNFEFSFKASDLNSEINMATKDSSAAWGIKPNISAGKIRLDGSEHFTYEPNKWYNVVFSYKFKATPGGYGICTVYVNGKKVALKETGSNANLSYERIEFNNLNNADTKLWVDDVKIYPVRNYLNSETIPDKYVAVSSAMENAGTLWVDNDTNEIALTSDSVNVGAVSEALAYTGVFDMRFYGADGTRVEAEDFEVTPGMKLQVANSDRSVLRTYTFTVEAEPELAVYGEDGTRLGAKMTGTSFTAKASSAASAGCMLVIASYTDDVMESCITADAANPATITVSDSINKVRAFLLAKGSIAPKTGAITLSK